MRAGWEPEGPPAESGGGEAPARFAYGTTARRVVFGFGASGDVAGELERLGAERALLVTTRGRLEARPEFGEGIGRGLAGVFDGARAQVPAEVAREAAEQAHRLGADVCVAFGGGSAIGVAKAVALETDLPIVAVPTTYSGSEMTAVWGISEDGRKRTGRDPRVCPAVVIYDPGLTLGLPPRIAAESGMNAVAHCVEALYAVDGNPVASMMAEKGIRLLAGALPELVGRSAPPARTKGSAEHAVGPALGRALLGAHLAGAALDQTSMGLHHKLCHVLAGSFGLPHAGVHARVLPGAAAYNAGAAPGAMRAIGRALGAGEASAPRALFELNRRLGIEGGLRALGLARDDLDRAADQATARPYPNPAPITRGGVRELLEAAWEGRGPASRS